MNEVAAFSMIYMSVSFGIAKDHIGAVAAYFLNQCPLVGFVILKKTIFKAHIFTSLKAKYFGCFGRFFQPQFGRATGSEFALCQINCYDLFTRLSCFGQCATTAQFNIVRMGSKG